MCLNCWCCREVFHRKCGRCYLWGIVCVLKYFLDQVVGGDVFCLRVGWVGAWVLSCWRYKFLIWLAERIWVDEVVWLLVTCE
jgi:hypothetical protein